MNIQYIYQLSNFISNKHKSGNAFKINDFNLLIEILNRDFFKKKVEESGYFENRQNMSYNDALRGQGTTTERHNYEFIDTSVEPGKEYTYLLADISYQLEENQHHDYVRKVYIPVGIEVGDAYPNPFNPLCVVPFTLDTEQHITVDLLNAQGKKIRIITDRNYSAGSHQITINDPSLSSGLYFVHIRSSVGSETRKILLMR